MCVAQVLLLTKNTDVKGKWRYFLLSQCLQRLHIVVEMFAFGLRCLELQCEAPSVVNFDENSFLESGFDEGYDMSNFWAC